ncbi:palA [Cucurbita argyrosperma subsp. argyrosperma]|nr:palA [Cucurbita argyrosperma subsp. argyrosperma]
MLLQFSDPAKLKTKMCVFEDKFIARDSSTLEQLKEMTSRRRVIEESINETSSITDAIAREMSGGLSSHTQQVLHKLLQYLPLLENFVSQVDLVGYNLKIVQWTSDLKIRWSSALSSSSLFHLRGPKFFQIDNLRFEVAMTLFLYGAVLRQRALEVISEDQVQSATFFREAAGVYQYLAKDILPSIQHCVPSERPPEAVTTMRAEEKGSISSLLAKLHYGIVDLLNESANHLRILSGESSSFLEFLSAFRALHELKSRKNLAKELMSGGQAGVAIGILRHALTDVKKDMPRENSWRLVFGTEIDSVAETLRKFERENEIVWHKKIPSRDELPTPKGSQIVTSIPYCPKKWERELAFKM